MNERSLRKLFRHVLLASVPVAASFACGGATAVDDPAGGAAGTGGTAGAGPGGSGGSVTVGGSGGSVTVGGSGGSVTVGGSGGSVTVGGSGGSTTVGGSSGRGGSAGKAADAGGSGGGLGGGPCSDFFGSPCSRCVALDGGAVVVDGGAIADCARVCGSTASCSPWPRDGLPLALVCTDFGGACNMVAGRRPAGLAVTSQTEARHPGDYFAEVALLEAASVDAFQVLRDELLHHGAPPSLVRAAERAARDEVRHARVMGALARRYGSHPRSPRVEKPPIRTLYDIALENATEGCVRETYGALLASHQARAAKSRLVRAAFARIAADETRHAALAWKVAAWLDGKLDDEARARVRQARRSAAEALAAEARVEPPRWVEAVGLPGASRSSRMADQMLATLWA